MKGIGEMDFKRDIGIKTCYLTRLQKISRITERNTKSMGKLVEKIEGDLGVLNSLVRDFKFEISTIDDLVNPQNLAKDLDVNLG